MKTMTKKIRVIGLAAALVVGGSVYAATSPAGAGKGPTSPPPAKGLNINEPHAKVGPDGQLIRNPDGTPRMFPPSNDTPPMRPVHP